MDVIAAAGVICGIVVTTAGAIWYKLGKVEQALEDLPCKHDRRRAICPDEMEGAHGAS